MDALIQNNESLMGTYMMLLRTDHDDTLINTAASEETLHLNLIGNIKKRNDYQSCSNGNV